MYNRSFGANSREFVQSKQVSQLLIEFECFYKVENFTIM